MKGIVYSLLLEVTILYSVFQTSLSVSIDGCVFPKHYPDSQATKKLESLINNLDKNRRFSTKDKEYSYTFGLCTDVQQPPDPSRTIGMLQKDLKDPQKAPTSVGDYTNASIIAGSNWMLLTYGGGDHYSPHHCGNGEARTSHIMLLCKPGEHQGSLRILEEETDKESECYYLFEFSHEAVCVITQESQGLSAGSIFIIILVVLAGTYLLGGFLYQRYIAGAKGLEQIPNFSFWKRFGNLQADGCDLVCRCGDRYSESRQYRNIGEENMDTPSSVPSDTRDDSLLPM